MFNNCVLTDWNDTTYFNSFFNRLDKMNVKNMTFSILATTLKIKCVNSLITNKRGKKKRKPRIHSLYTPKRVFKLSANTANWYGAVHEDPEVTDDVDGSQVILKVDNSGCSHESF